MKLLVRSSLVIVCGLLIALIVYTAWQFFPVNQELNFHPHTLDKTVIYHLDSSQYTLTWEQDQLIMSGVSNVQGSISFSLSSISNDRRQYFADANFELTSEREGRTIILPGTGCKYFSIGLGLTNDKPSQNLKYIKCSDQL